MLVSITCGCGHRGFVRKTRLPGWFRCSCCGRGQTFQSGASLRPPAKPQHSRRPTKRQLQPGLGADAVLRAASDPGVSDDQLIALLDAAEY
jgi:hypothetical protein